MKKLNIGMVGYGFMGRTHSNAFSQVNHFFDVPYQPVLKTVCARNADRAQRVRRQVGLRIGGDGLAQAGGIAGYRPDRYRQPERYARGDRDCGGEGGQDGDVREAAGPQRRGRRGHGEGGGSGGRAEHGLVQLPARAGGDAGQAIDRRRAAGTDLSLSREVPAGLDDFERPAAGRRGAVAAGCERGGQRRDGRSAGALHRYGDVAERRHRRSDGA